MNTADGEGFTKKIVWNFSKMNDEYTKIYGLNQFKWVEFCQKLFASKLEHEYAKIQEFGKFGICREMKQQNLATSTYPAI